MMKKQTTVTTLPRVLIVDDDAMVRLLAISALGQLDLDLHEAGDGQTCLRPRDRFWGLGCPKIYHEVEDTLGNVSSSNNPAPISSATVACL